MHNPRADLDEGVHPPPTPRKNKIYWIHLEKLPEICPPPLHTHTHTPLKKHNCPSTLNKIYGSAHDLLYYLIVIIQ